MDTHAAPRKLLKKSKGPPISFNNNARNHALQRAPSAPTYPSFHQQRSAEHLQLGTLPQAAHHYTHQDSSPPSLVRRTSNPQFSLQSAGGPSAQSSQHSLRTAEDLVGKPFDAAAINKSITAALQQRPPPPQHSLTADYLPAPQPKKSSSSKSPKLRQSASFTLAQRKMNDTITPPRSDGGTKSPRQRYSDEADSSHAKNRKSDGGKKKGTFSSFMNSMLGSPRRPTISTPTNPMHVTHVSIDNETGEFTVRVAPQPLLASLC